ncbi:DbpA RNA binding domain-containing protein [Crenothrix polyspora]|uniref:DbpA RNA-binding domain-containing protein n=1 Tax=Crenothrix polyspora TaxID=360316 RepID=A0A1R4HDA4_9GAMM|nr:DbpA RNA binding domain-containing protein [Crenothrix polyspora]SJM94187.1 DbpA RNA-binding domain-containing protein [Crenothrix polyspora]
MSTHQALPSIVTESEQLKARLQVILSNQDLHAQRVLLLSLADDLAVDFLDCAAALLAIIQKDKRASAALLMADNAIILPLVSVSNSVGNTLRAETDNHTVTTLSALNIVMPAIKMLRYRLDIGKKHQLTLTQLKKLLVEESGVDENNINNVMIHGQYTLVELPDDMPQDIFQHLRSVEFNQQQLNIKRLKSRSKKHNYNRFRRGKPRAVTLADPDSN